MSIDVTPFSFNTDPELNSDWIVLLMKPLKSSYGTGAQLTLLQVFRPTSMTACILLQVGQKVGWMISRPMYSVSRYFYPLKDTLLENIISICVSTHGSKPQLTRVLFQIQVNSCEPRLESGGHRTRLMPEERRRVCQRASAFFDSLVSIIICSFLIM